MKNAGKYRAPVNRRSAFRLRGLGLAVPGMVSGSPGMENGYKQPYQVLAFTKDGKSTVYADKF